MFWTIEALSRDSSINSLKEDPYSTSLPEQHQHVPRSAIHSRNGTPEGEERRSSLEHEAFTNSPSTMPQFHPNNMPLRDPEKVSKAYTANCVWRNRSVYVTGTAAIISFLADKWAREKNYRLRKELFAFTDNKIAVQFWYEYQDAEDGMKWKRCHGLEDWTFAPDGTMEKRMMSGNDFVLKKGERWFVEGVEVGDVDISGFW